MKNWSDKVWLDIEPIFESILCHPFVCELASGTLQTEKFAFYIEQDALYIENYSRVLAHIASRLANKGHVEKFINFASDGIQVEKSMHQCFIGKDVDENTRMSPTCLLYTSLLSAQSMAPVQVEAAAVLPCFWVYQRVGAHICKIASDNNPYQRWIDTYADPVFEKSTRQAIDICDSLADKADNSTVEAMTEIFKLCTKMEWMFWDSAYNFEKWKI